MFERYSELQQAREDGTESGFTLIELLIVIVVLGILAAVTVFALSSVTAQSAQASCNADAKSVVVAAEAYRAQKGVYPPNGMSDLTAGAAYLRSAPAGGTHYAVTLTAGTGAVMVSAPASAAAANYDTANPCASAT